MAGPIGGTERLHTVSKEERQKMWLYYRQFIILGYISKTEALELTAKRFNTKPTTVAARINV